MKLSSLFNMLYKLLRTSKEIRKALELTSNPPKHHFRSTIKALLAWNPFRVAKKRPSIDYQQGHFDSLSPGTPPTSKARTSIDSGPHPGSRKPSGIDFGFDPQFGFGIPEAVTQDKSKRTSITEIEGPQRRKDRYGLDYKCFYCEKKFDSDRKRKSHAISHTKILLFCFKCPMSFSSRAKLDSHCAKVHSHNGMVRFS